MKPLKDEAYTQGVFTLGTRGLILQMMTKVQSTNTLL
jgi:hypothetical protein